MPTYVYECPEHGQFDVVKPMADSGREEPCPVEDWRPYAENVLRKNTTSASCPRLTRRIYTMPSIQGETVPGGVHGGSGDGYVFDSKTGLTSRRPKSKRWI